MDKIPTLIIWVTLLFVAYEVYQKFQANSASLLPATPVTLGTNNPVPSQSSVPTFGQAAVPISIIDQVTPGSGYQGAVGVDTTAPTFTGFGGAL